MATHGIICAEGSGTSKTADGLLIIAVQTGFKWLQFTSPCVK